MLVIFRFILAEINRKESSIICWSILKIFPFIKIFKQNNKLIKFSTKIMENFK